MASITGKAKLRTAFDHEKIRILHVDDDPSMTEVLKDLLININSKFEVDSACCVSEGLSKLEAVPYDVVISDYSMPQKDGLEFLRVT